MAATFRGLPRTFAATNLQEISSAFLFAVKTYGFIGVSSDFTAVVVRGTAIAIRVGMMTEVTNPTTNPAADQASCDWLTAHGDYLFNLAVGQLRDASVAEDLVQETFLAALKARDRFAGTSSTRTWLVGILRHKIYDHLRRVCRERPAAPELFAEAGAPDSWEASLIWLHQTAAECNSPSRRMELAEFRDALEAALGKLPPRIAQVFQLYEIEERANHEVCSHLNISESNLWVMLHRARKQLRQELGEWWGNESQTIRTESLN